MHRLPSSLQEVEGLRAALWVRESTTGQFDNYGPDAQLEQYRSAIDRWQLKDTGIEWRVAASGRTIGGRAEFSSMLDAAGKDFDVLVVGYVSRFARDLRTAVNARHELHAKGSAILFADERLLTSDEDAWDAWAREAVEAESYSRKLGRRIKEGLAAKRRKHGVPGGNKPPFGMVRLPGPPWLSEDPERMPLVREAFKLAEAGASDRTIARATGLRKTHVGELLTNPAYVGKLKTGEQSALGPVIDQGQFERVQALRARFSRRKAGRPASRHPYALSPILHCASCGRRITGHAGRYRHVEPCQDWLRSAPEGKRGESYPAELYDRLGLAVMERAAGRADLLDQAAEAASTGDVDNGALDRLHRARQAAALRFAEDRDQRKFESQLRAIDAEEAALSSKPAQVTTEEARAWLEDLPGLWKAASPEARRAIASAAFERVEVLGLGVATVKVHTQAAARGFTVAVGEFELTGTYGRGERCSGPDKYLQRVVVEVA